MTNSKDLTEHEIIINVINYRNDRLEIKLNRIIELLEEKEGGE